MKSMSQIEYHIDELLREKEILKKVEIEVKVAEFTRILTEQSTKDEEELKRILMMMARDLRNIVEQ
ncbi:hypothetical protein [Paenibacillus donghaensis]|uniref:Uncharacterized protein n=1 Tax=Paenibacillus donghaensis TaxID=414771 RepID=A0A2Z2KHQ1_9BACL|nr:hypothetical protein [Paenibacillus donghaensis]ASA22710.1 hypothetical protein B9T62_19075 [Paenibacillus donghaensis]